MLTDISIQGSRRIVVSGLRIRPADQPAIVDVSDSRDVTFRNVRFLGVNEDLGVALQLDPDDRDITVADSEFAHCQHGLACVLARGRGVTIDNVRFHDVRDADIVRGAADDVVIRDSDLHDALPGTHGDNHNDLIQILGGGPWTIERCHFGVRANGAAQVYVDPRPAPPAPVHDVHVTSSVFTGSNKDMFFAVNVREPASSSVPLATRRRVRQQHDRLGEHRGDRARRRVRRPARGRSARSSRTTSSAARSTRCATSRARSRT